MRISDWSSDVCSSDLLGGNFLGQLRTEVLERVVELDLASHGHTIVGDGGRAPLLVQHDVAALGAKRHLDRVGQGVDAPLQRAARVLIELKNLRHVFLLKRVRVECSAGCRGSHASTRPVGNQETTMARTPRAFRIRYSSPPYLTSVPPYLL